MSDPISGIGGINLATLIAEMDPNDLFSDQPLPAAAPPKAAPLPQADELTISAAAQMESMRIMSSGNAGSVTTLRSLVQTQEAIADYPVPIRASVLPAQVADAGIPQTKAHVSSAVIEMPATTALVLKDTRTEIIPFASTQSQTQVMENGGVDDVEKIVVVLGRTVVPRSVDDDDRAWSRSLTRTLKIGVVLTAVIFLLLYILR